MPKTNWVHFILKRLSIILNVIVSKKSGNQSTAYTFHQGIISQKVHKSINIIDRK